MILWQNFRNYKLFETSAKYMLPPTLFTCPFSKLHSILAVTNLFSHNNISQICYCDQISLQSAAVNCSFLTNWHLWRVTFILTLFCFSQDLSYIMHTADVVAHDLWQVTLKKNLVVHQNITNMIAQYFPGVPVISTLGNHEAEPVNMWVLTY